MAAYNKKKKSYIPQRVLISLLLTVCIVFNSVFFVYNSVINRINIVAPSEPLVTFTDYPVSETDMPNEGNTPEGVIVKDDDVSLYLLIGSDSRFGLNSESRSDSMIIVAVDRKHNKIKLISLMRDMLVKMAGTKAYYSRLNSAYSRDSNKNDLNLPCTRQTIEDTFGIQLDEFVVVDFTGFKKVIDMMGGVEMTLTSKEANYMCSDKKYGKFKKYTKGAGTYNMTGAEALNYARMRHVGNSDFSRTERQRKLISAILGKMKNQSYTEMAAMATVALGYVTTNVQQGEILGLAFEAPTLLNYEIVQYRLPINGSFESKTVIIDGFNSSTLWCDYSFNSTQLNKFLYEDDMTYAGNSYKAVYIKKLPALPSTVKVPSSTTTTTTTAATE